MNTIHIHRADPVRPEAVPEPVTITIEDPLTDAADYAFQTDADAEQLVDALWKVLPGATIDAVLRAMLLRRACLLRVPMPQPARFEPAVDAEGAEVWLNHLGWVEWLGVGDPAPDGWRRLYVEREPDGGDPS